MICCSQVYFSKPQALCLATATGELCYSELVQSVPARIRGFPAAGGSQLPASFPIIRWGMKIVPFCQPHCSPQSPATASLPKPACVWVT